MIKFEDIVKNKEYRERVIKFFRLPIRLSVSLEKFNSDMEFIKKVDSKKYRKIVDLTEEDFNKLVEEQETIEPDFTMENVLEPLLREIEETEEWKMFLEEDNSNVLDDYDGITNVHGFYAKENDGKHFLSIDLKAANWQSLQSIIGFNEDYEEVITKYTGNAIPPISKTFRTKITGVLGAKKIMDYNKKLLKDNKNKILEIIYEETGVDLINKEPFAFYADEILIEVDQDTLVSLMDIDMDSLEKQVSLKSNVNVHLTPFTLKWLGIDKSCAKIYKSNEYEIINISKDILLIMNKIKYNIKPNEIDYLSVNMKGYTKEDFVSKVEETVRELESL